MRSYVPGSLKCPWFELPFRGGPRLFQPRVHLLVDIALRHCAARTDAVGGLFIAVRHAEAKVGEANRRELPAQMLFEEILRDAVLFERGTVLLLVGKVLLAEIGQHR